MLPSDTKATEASWSPSWSQAVAKAVAKEVVEKTIRQTHRIFGTQGVVPEMIDRSHSEPSAILLGPELPPLQHPEASPAALVAAIIDDVLSESEEQFLGSRITKELESKVKIAHFNPNADLFQADGPAAGYFQVFVQYT